MFSQSGTPLLIGTLFTGIYILLRGVIMTPPVIIDPSRKAAIYNRFLGNTLYVYIMENIYIHT